MKKVLSLTLGCLSVVSLAHAQSTDALMNLAQTFLLPAEDVFTAEKPTLSQTALGYAVNVPSFTDMDNTVPAYTLNLNQVNGQTGIYRVEISDVNQYKNLGSLLKSLDITSSSFKYWADLDAQKGIAKDQEFSLDNLFKAIDEQKTEYVRIKSVSVKSKSVVSEEGALSSQANVLISSPEAVSSFFNFKAKDLTVYSQGEILKPPFDNMDDITNMGNLSVKLKMNGVSVNSFLAPASLSNLDLSVDADMKENKVTKDATLEMKIHLDNIRVKTDVEKVAKYLPTSADMNWVATGFTYADLNEVSKAQRALAQFPEQNLPEAVRAETEQALQKNLEAKKEAFSDNLKLDILSSVSSKDYKAELSGKADAKEESFIGTLKITNFDFLAPAPRKIDAKRCDAAKKNLTTLYMESNGKFDDNKMKDIMTEVQNACDEGRGPLDALRKYLPTAKKSKNANGQDVTTFDLKFVNDVFYINGQELKENED